MSRRLLLPLLLASMLSNAALIVAMRYPAQTRAALLYFRAVPAVRADDHVRGPANARITVIEYADFFCPVCRESHMVLQKLVAEGKIRWVYRHFPIPELHPAARLASEAAECAAAQNRFWSFADAVYREQPRLDSLRFKDIAHDAGVDSVRFAICMSSAAQADKVIQAHEEAQRLRLSGTPTFFVNGTRIEGLASEQQFRDRALRQ